MPLLVSFHRFDQNLEFNELFYVFPQRESPGSIKGRWPNLVLHSDFCKDVGMEDLKVLSTDPLCPLVQGIQQIPSWLRLSTSHLMWRLMICLPALLQIQPKLILWTGLRRCSVNIWRVATISLLCQDHRTSTFP